MWTENVALPQLPGGGGGGVGLETGVGVGVALPHEELPFTR